MILVRSRIGRLISVLVACKLVITVGSTSDQPVQAVGHADEAKSNVGIAAPTKKVLIGRKRRSVPPPPPPPPATSDHGPGSSWSQVQFGPKKIGSTRFHSFRLNVFNDTGNEGLDSRNNRYFYTPVSFLNLDDSTYCASDADSDTHEVVVSLTMWNDESQVSARRFLDGFLCQRHDTPPRGCPITEDNVEVVPFEQVRLVKKKSAKQTQFYGCTLDSAWTPYQGQQVVEFTLSCLDEQGCESLVTAIQEKPRRFANHLQLALSLTSVTKGTRTKKIRVTNLLDSKLAARIDQHFTGKNGNADRALLTADVHKKLLQEVAASVVIDTFDDSDDLVDDWTHDNVIRIVEKFLDSSTQRVMDAASNEASWESLFWMEENYRPDKTAATLNEVHKELGAEDKKYLEAAFSTSSKDDLSVSSKVAGGGPVYNAEVSAAVSTSNETSKSTSLKTEEFSKLLQNGKELVKWDGEKFVPKEMVVVGINLAHLRDTRSLTDQQVRVRYAPSVLTAPLNIPQPANEVRESFLRDIEKDIYGNMSSLETKMDELEAGSAQKISSVKSDVQKLEVRIDRLEEQNAKFVELHSELTKAAGTQKNRSIIDVLRRRIQGLDVVAFDVYRNSRLFYTEDAVNSVITYESTLVNIGDAISPAEGVFRAPYAGVYAFDLHFDEPGGPGESRIQIRVNGGAVATVAKGGGGRDDSGSGESVVVRLAPGDRVDTCRVSGGLGGAADAHFAGFLIAEIF